METRTKDVKNLLYNRRLLMTMTTTMIIVCMFNFAIVRNYRLLMWSMLSHKVFKLIGLMCGQ